MSSRFKVQDATGVVLTHPYYGALHAVGTTVPADGVAGYAPGCLFMDLDAAVGYQLFSNTGSRTSCKFRPVGFGGPLGDPIGLGANGVYQTLTLTAAAHAGRTIALDDAAGGIVVLPAATGSGVAIEFVVTVLALNNQYIVRANAEGETFQGQAVLCDTDSSGATLSFMAVAGTDDTCTLNRTTTGSVTKGEYLLFRDVAAGVWQVNAWLSATGAPATPFSNAAL